MVQPQYNIRLTRVLQIAWSFAFRLKHGYQEYAGRRLLIPLDPGQAEQCAFLENSQGGIADLQEDGPDGTGSLFPAFLAGLVVIFRHAGQQGDGAVEEAHDLDEADLLG